MAVEDHIAANSPCPSLDELLDSCRGGTVGKTSCAEHLEQCERCNEALTLTLVESDRFVTVIRGENPLRIYQSESELYSMLAKSGQLARTGLTLTATSDHSTTKSSRASIPTQINGYTILDELASGGMGVVYRAHQPALNRDVALKMVLPHATSPTALKRFHAEGIAVAHLQHPHIIQIFELGEHDGRPYFSMELLEGGDLKQRLRRQGMTAEQAVDLTALLADAINYSHTKRVLHRDLKPSNVLFTAAGVPKVSDFGLAKYLESEESRELTQDDTVLGTPGYMAPEQARGAISEIGPAADVYGLGAILYRILTGHAPFEGKNKLETLERVRRQPTVAPSQYNPELCPDLESICLKCLAKSPQHRYESADQLAADLRRWRAGEMPRARREKRRRSVKFFAAIAVIVALTIGSAWFLNAAYLARNDPRVHRNELELLLSGDEPVTLVAATGLPRWHCITGQPSVAEALQTGYDQTAVARSQGVTIVVLADDPQHASYRLRAEIRHDFAGRADCGAGLIVGMREEPFGDDFIQMGCVLRFNDLRDARDTAAQIQAIRPDLPIPPILGNSLRFMPCVILARDDLPEPLEPRLAGADLTFEPDYTGQKWRQIEIEVHPDRMQARWEDGEQTLVLRMDESQYRMQERLLTLYQRFGVPPPDPLPTIDTRGSLGVFVRDGSVSFRNVIIEPLAPVLQ